MQYNVEKRRLEKISGWQAQSVTWIPPDVPQNILPAAHTVYLYVFRVDIKADSSGRAF